MPEMTFTVRWPDGRVQECWSPSLVMWDHLEVGAEYAVAEFAARAVAGLEQGGERVRARYGFLCTAAREQAQRLTERAAAQPADGRVVVLAMTPPLSVTP